MRARVGSLVVQLGRVMRHREINLQDGAVGNLLRIERHLHRLGVAGAAGADHLIMRRLFVAAGIAGDGRGHPLGMLKHRLHAPKAAACQHHGLHTGARRRWRIHGRRGYHHRRLRRHCSIDRPGEQRDEQKGRQRLPGRKAERHLLPPNMVRPWGRGFEPLHPYGSAR